MSNKHLVAVDAGALQMVFNILGRGTPVQREASDELKKTVVSIEDLGVQVNIDKEIYNKFLDSEGTPFPPEALQNLFNWMDVMVTEKEALNFIQNLKYGKMQDREIPIIEIGDGRTAFRAFPSRKDNNVILMFNQIPVPQEPGSEVDDEVAKSAQPFFAIEFTRKESLKVFSDVIAGVTTHMFSEE